MRVSIRRDFDEDRITATLSRDSGLGKLTVEIKKHEIKVLKGNSTKNVTIGELTEQERLGLFRVILAEYRQYSFGDGGYKGAAIGITDDNRIFIGLNTKRQHPYFKDCAEQNMLNNMTDAISFSAMKNDHKLPDHLPKLKSLYMMGGAPAEGDKKGLAISCPCGKCVDMLAEAMSSETAPIYVLPIPEQNLPDVVEDPFPFGIKIAQDGRVLAEIDHTKNIWKVPIGYLNQNRTVTLKGDEPSYYVNGVKQLMGRLGELQTELPFDAESTARLAAQVAKKKETHSENVYELERLMKEHKGETAPIDQFLRKEIDEAIESRWHTYAKQCEQDGVEADKDVFRSKLGTVRCVVLQLQDGTYRAGLETDTDFDNAIPNGDVNALTASLKTITEHRVQNVWAMEIRMEDVQRIEQGEQKPIMHTSAKEGIERISKRGAPDLKFHYIPYNDGSLSEEQLSNATYSFKPHEIFPSNFKGIKLNGNGNHGAAAGVA